MVTFPSTGSALLSILVTWKLGFQIVNTPEEADVVICSEATALTFICVKLVVVEKP